MGSCNPKDLPAILRQGGLLYVGQKVYADFTDREFRPSHAPQRTRKGTSVFLQIVMSMDKILKHTQIYRMRERVR